MWRLETLQWLELRLHASALRPVRRRRQWLRHVPLGGLAMPRTRGADAADTWVDADEDTVHIKGICLFGACGGVHPYLRFLNNPHCPCHVPCPLTKRPLAAPPAPNPLHPVPTHAPTHGCGYDSDSDSDRWYNSGTTHRPSGTTTTTTSKYST